MSAASLPLSGFAGKSSAAILAATIAAFVTAFAAAVVNAPSRRRQPPRPRVIETQQGGVEIDLSVLARPVFTLLTPPPSPRRSLRRTPGPEIR